jgi:hypothetical protein
LSKLFFLINRLGQSFCPVSKQIFGIMLHDLGLPNARYTSHTHEDGEVSAIVTYYGPSEIPGKLLQQFKIGGAPAAVI